MDRIVTTFPKRSEYEKAKAGLEALSLPYEVISPDPAYSLVGAGAVVMDQETRMALAEGGFEFFSSGWVDHRGASAVPDEPRPEFVEDIFGHAAVMILASCTADETKIRVIAHISGDMAEAFPYLNAEMPEGFYNARGPSFTFMEQYRLITLYPTRIAVAKADDIVDAWRCLETVRRRTNDAWSRRGENEPDYSMRRRPAAIEIYQRLPRTNCRACGLATCLAFAMRVQLGHVPVSLCKPVFGGEHAHLRDALVQISAGMAGGD